MWDVEPDSNRRIAHSVEQIVPHVLRSVRPGSIILLHVMQPERRASLEAVPLILTGLRARGYRFVTVSQLLEAPPSGRRSQRAFGDLGQLSIRELDGVGLHAARDLRFRDEVRDVDGTHAVTGKARDLEISAQRCSPRYGC